VASRVGNYPCPQRAPAAASPASQATKGGQHSTAPPALLQTLSPPPLAVCNVIVPVSGTFSQRGRRRRRLGARAITTRGELVKAAHDKVGSMRDVRRHVEAGRCGACDRHDDRLLRGCCWKCGEGAGVYCRQAAQGHLPGRRRLRRVNGPAASGA
jgi:hypothetical protein